MSFFLSFFAPEKLIAYQREFHALKERLRVAEHRTLQRSSELNTILEQFRRAIAETNSSKDALTNFSGNGRTRAALRSDASFLPHWNSYDAVSPCIRYIPISPSSPSNSFTASLCLFLRRDAETVEGAGKQETSPGAKYLPPPASPSQQ